MTSPNIVFTTENFKKFKQLYAATQKGDVFVFEGREVLHDYAKYVIEYLEPKFRKGGTYGAQKSEEYINN